MEKLRTFLLAFLMLIGCVTVSAYDVEVDGIYYDLDATSHEAKVTYKALDWNVNQIDYSGDVVIPATISVEGVAYGVTSIGEDAFNGCSDLTSIALPEGLTSIGNGAFDGCSGLTSIALPEGLTSIGDWAFFGCSGLTSIALPEGLTSIGISEFYGCNGLTSITLPESVTSIGEQAFYGCSGLTSIALPEGVTSIGNRAFRGCSGLTSITIPESVTSIGEQAFSECSGLTSIVVEEGNGHYDSRNNCNAIIETGTNTLIVGCKSTINPNGITSIGNWAFFGCSGLTSITLPDGVTSIGNSAFRDCRGLTSITIPEGVTSIGSYAFDCCSGLTSITIPEGVTSIGSSAFGSCRGLTSIALPEGLTSIGYGAFDGCSGLTSITLPEGLTSIGGYVFYGCSGLTSITIPESVTYMDYGAISNCNALQSVKMLSSTPPAVSQSSIFHECPGSLVIYVPAGASANYDVAPWNNYQIVEKTCMEDYAIWASDMKTRPTKPITLSIQLNNVAAISDYQFDLYLPEGFSIAKDEEGLDMIYLSSARTDERQHTFAYNTIYDGALRVICYSNSTATFSGNKGEVLTITLDVAEDVADEEYSLYLKNIEMTEPDGTAHKIAQSISKVTVISYTPGDANNDGSFSVTDVRGIVNMVLAAQSPDDNLAADVNEDGIISVTDVRGVVNLVLNPVAPTAMLSPKMRAATSSTNLLYIEPFTIAPGEEKEVLVMLNNPGDAFSDIQFDLYLPEGIEVLQDEIGYWIDLGSRTTSRKHNLPEAALQKDGAVRVLCYTNRDYVFSGESGDVMVITLKAADNLAAGVYNLELKNVELARPNMTNDKPQAYAASVLSSNVNDREVALQGYFSAEAMSELNAVLATATNVAAVDLSPALYVDAESELTIGNPNALILLTDGMTIGNSQNVVVNGICENLTLSDAHPFHATTDFTAENFGFERNFTEAKVASFVLPAEIPTSAVNGKVYKLTGVNGNVLKFSEVTSGLLEANMPYMVEVAAAGELLSGVLSDVAIAATPAEIVNTIDNVQHIGAYQQSEVVSNALCTYYGFTGGEFVKANNGTLKPFRTMIAAGNASLTNKYLLDFGNGTTGIGSLEAGIERGDIYDLNGRKVQQPAKGVYVINGKKVIVK